MSQLKKTKVINTENLQYFDFLIQEGWNQKIAPLNLDDEQKQLYRDRVKYERDTLVSKGFIDYMLIVQDYVNFAKNNGVLTGAGRGSAAGSLIAFLLHITEIDPLKYNLLFERFLNPARTKYDFSFNEYPVSQWKQDNGIIDDDDDEEELEEII
jgi:DNA polymerase III alpha subunit